MDDVLRIIEHNISLLSDKSESITNLTKEMYREAALLVKSSDDISTVDDAVCIFERIHGKNLSDVSINEFAEYCLGLAGVCENQIGAFQALLPDGRSSASIAYLQNSYSDTAFRKFSSYFKNASAIYFPGFREVCEDVYYGRSTHAIIPIYTSKDGQLLSFRKLISKYELKIVSECSVEMNDDTVMRFALLQKNLLIPDGKSYVDLSVILPDRIRSGDFMASIERLGCRIVMINSNPLEYADDKYSLGLQLDMFDADLNALYLFLEGTQISYDILGIYSVIDENI